MLSERQKRIAVMRQFELQYPKYPIKILERLTNFRYRIFEENRQIEVLATVLASSWDFYEHRLNLAKHGFNLIICQKHNAAVPLLTLELDTQVMYGASAVPDRAPDRRAVRSDEGAKEEKEGKHKRRTPDERRILI